TLIASSSSKSLSTNGDVLEGGGILSNVTLNEEEAIKVTEKKNLENYIEDETLEIDEIVNIKESRNHQFENVIGNLNQRTLRSQAQNQRCEGIANVFLDVCGVGYKGCDFGLSWGAGTTFSSPNHLLEEFSDELALITFPPGNDDLPFDIKSDLREIEYLLNRDPTKEIYSILEDLVDVYNLTDSNNNLFDTIPKMFI
nr:hypothetical protein [Tanacetum cinerariifolium]